jgi:hypothetical protein
MKFGRRETGQCLHKSRIEGALAKAAADRDDVECHAPQPFGCPFKYRGIGFVQTTVSARGRGGLKSVAMIRCDLSRSPTPMNYFQRFGNKSSASELFRFARIYGT